MTTNSALPHTIISVGRTRAIAVALAFALVIAVAPWGAVAQEQQVADRVGEGTDVVTSAVSLSQATFAVDGEASFVVVGRDDEFPDNLVAMPLAGRLGPLLYTTGGPDADLRPETLAEILRVVRPKERPCEQNRDADVFIIGGVDAVSDSAAQQIQAEGFCVQRIAGPTRYETAGLIASEVARRQLSRSILIVRADDWADAATGGALAAHYGIPIMVTDPDSMHPELRAMLSTGRYRFATILGGTAAISAEIEAEIAQLAVTRRVAGDARDLTALAIAEFWLSGFAVDGVQLVNGYVESGWAYAFAAGALSAATNRPQLYTHSDALPVSTCRRLAEGTSFASVVGPEEVISEEVRRQADLALSSGTCDPAIPPSDTLESGLAMGVPNLAAGPDDLPGLYVSGESGSGVRLVAAGNFDFPAWHPDGQRIAVVQLGYFGQADSIVLVSFDGSEEPLMSVDLDAGERLGRIAINPAVTPIEVAYELVLPVPEGEGGDPATFIETYSEANGRERLTGGGAQMSDEPYSADGRLTYFESGQIIYQDADHNPQVLDFGSFAEPEWGPDGSIVYQTNDGVVVREVGSTDPAALVGPGSFGEADWYPATPGQEPRLALNASGLVDGTEIHAVGNGPAILGGVTGVSPDVSPDGQFLATSVQDGQGVTVYDANTFAVSAEVDLPAASFAYPPSLFEAP